MREGWKIELLKNACKVFTDGNWIESKDQSPEGIRLVQTGNIGFGYFRNKDDKSRFISEETFERLKCTEILPGDLLVSRLPDPVGKSCIIPDLDIKMITGVDCTIIRPNHYLISEFLGYFQMSDEYLKDVQSRVSGTTRSRISRKNLGLIQIPIPPLQEQQQIVAILDQAFEAIDQAKTNIEKNRANAKELFQSKLNAIFSHPSTSSGQDGDGWEEKSLGEVYDVRDGTHDSPKYQEEGYPLITSKNLKDNLINYDKVKFISNEDFIDINKRSKVDIGDVLFAMIGTIGNPVVITNKPDFAIKNVALFKVPNQQSSMFLRYYLNSVIGKMISEAKGTTQPFVGLGYLRNFPINIPSYNEQNKIVEMLNDFETNSTNIQNIYKQKLKNLEDLKKSILQKAFAGELTNKEESVHLKQVAEPEARYSKK